MSAVSKKSAFPATVQPGIPKLGDCPSGWNRAPLGKFVREARRPLKMEDDKKYRLLTVKRGRGGVVEREYLVGNKISVKSQFTVEAGDFLISKRQIVHGACGIVPSYLEGSIVSNEYSVLRGTEEIDMRFLKYLAHSVYFQQTCFHSSIGVHIEKMIFKLDRWLNWNFDLPPLPEQQKIVEILSTWDRVIETVEKLTANSRAQKRALMQKLLTGGKRLPSYTGIWKQEPLQKHAVVYDGTHSTPDYVDEGIPFYSVEHISKNNFKNTKFISEDVFERENKRVRIEKFDILMTRIGDVGTAKLIDWEVKASFYVSLALIKPNKSIFPAFLCHYIGGPLFQSELNKRMIHVAFPKKINLGEIGKCDVRTPSLDEQKAIASVLDDATKNVHQLEQKLTCLKTEKAALMQQLLTGKRRVKIEREEAA